MLGVTFKLMMKRFHFYFLLVLTANRGQNDLLHFIFSTWKLTDSFRWTWQRPIRLDRASTLQWTRACRAHRASNRWVRRPSLDSRVSCASTASAPNWLRGSFGHRPSSKRKRRLSAATATSTARWWPVSSSFCGSTSGSSTWCRSRSSSTWSDRWDPPSECGVGSRRVPSPPSASFPSGPTTTRTTYFRSRCSGSTRCLCFYRAWLFFQKGDKDGKYFEWHRFLFILLRWTTRGLVYTETIIFRGFTGIFKSLSWGKNS